MTIYEAFSLLGGVGLFLYGMTIMSTGLRNACGDNLRVLLGKATKNKITSVLAGIAVTVLIQSSSATDVMVIGFVTSGLMTLIQAIGVIMGANIGTTVTAQITAFNISAYAPMILFIGAVMTLFLKNKRTRDIGSVILGFGMLFVGISFMKSAITPLSQTKAFISFLSTLSNPVITVLFGIAFTALLQSSSSATVIFQAFAMQGIIDYRTAVYLVIGAAVGSVTPNLLAGLTANRAGRRCSVLNLLFNVIRALLVLTVITIFPQITTFIQNLSPGNVARQIANTHTIFAIFAVVVLLPFAEKIVALSERIIPITEQERRKGEDRKLIYLTQTDRLPAGVAIDLAHREVTRMGQIAVKNLALATQCFFTHDQALAEQVAENEETVDYLAQAIVDKLVELRMLDLHRHHLNRLYRMIMVVDDLERISDHAENIVEYEEVVRSGKAVIHDEARGELQELTDVTLQSLQVSLEIFEKEDFERYGEAERLENLVDDKKDEIDAKHLVRLMEGTCDPQGGVLFTDMTIDLERCSDHALNMAQALLPEKVDA
ncbi:MAG: Na/Pi cotransporter family protein [Lachnospiraceae bacterium]|nr:Na/Pi cotransporter family protein [Lachnospiraceae bacterium]